VIRKTNQFSVKPLDPIFDAVTRGAHASSWARLEDGEVTLLALRTEGLDGGRDIRQFEELANTTASVVIASTTQRGLGSTVGLAVVPYGDGLVTLNFSSEAYTVAEITEHYLIGESLTNRLNIENGRLEVPLRESTAGGELTTWIAITILR
jgi:hypothetical protein